MPSTGLVWLLVLIQPPLYPGMARLVIQMKREVLFKASCWMGVDPSRRVGNKTHQIGPGALRKEEGRSSAQHSPDVKVRPIIQLFYAQCVAGHFLPQEKA